MSILNGTLIIQAFNFYVGFLIIKHIFFKPAIAHIQAQDLVQESLITTIQEHQQSIAQKEQEIIERSRALKSYFSARMANAFQEVETPLASYTFKKLEFSKHDTLSAAHQVAALVASRIEHA